MSLIESWLHLWNLYFSVWFPSLELKFGEGPTVSCLAKWNANLLAGRFNTDVYTFYKMYNYLILHLLCIKHSMFVKFSFPPGLRMLWAGCLFVYKDMKYLSMGNCIHLDTLFSQFLSLKRKLLYDDQQLKCLCLVRRRKFYW